MFAVVRIRGSVNVEIGVADTLKMLRLSRVNHCTLLPDNPVSRGMLQKARSYVTWGKIDTDTLEKLVAKRGRLPKDQKVPGKDAKEMAKKLANEKTAKEIGIKPVFRLSPPSKGYRSVRLPYPKGDFGDRGAEINALLKRMI